VKKVRKFSLGLINYTPYNEDVWGSRDTEPPFSTQHLIKVCGQHHALAALPQEEITPGTLYIGD
jgi:hypothetical protein